MKAKRFDYEELEELLARSEEREPPPWLLPRIMAGIEERESSPIERLRRWWFRPQAVSFSPARLGLTVTVTLCVFWLGIFVGRLQAPEAGGEGALFADNGEANYLIGRGLLAAGRVDQALPYLRQAVQQDPASPEFAHWQGVAYGKLGAAEEERASYFASVQDEPDYLPSLLNLGHNYLESGQYQQALAQYDKVLQADPGQPNALYNRALAYQMLDDPARAELAYLTFLEHNRTGKWASRALGHLHRLGNFTFRSYWIGAANLILNAEALLDQDPAGRRKELQYLAAALARTPGSELHLVAYHQGDRKAAKAAVNALQGQLTKLLGKEQSVPVRGSWFDVAESFVDANGAERQQTAGLLIFTRSEHNNHRKNSI